MDKQNLVHRCGFAILVHSAAKKAGEICLAGLAATGAAACAQGLPGHLQDRLLHDVANRPQEPSLLYLVAVEGQHQRTIAPLAVSEREVGAVDASLGELRHQQSHDSQAQSSEQQETTTAPPTPEKEIGPVQAQAADPPAQQPDVQPQSTEQQETTAAPPTPEKEIGPVQAQPDEPTQQQSDVQPQSAEQQETAAPPPTQEREVGPIEAQPPDRQRSEVQPPSPEQQETGAAPPMPEKEVGPVQAQPDEPTQQQPGVQPPSPEQQETGAAPPMPEKEVGPVQAQPADPPAQQPDVQPQSPEQQDATAPPLMPENEARPIDAQPGGSIQEESSVQTQTPEIEPGSEVQSRFEVLFEFNQSTLSKREQQRLDGFINDVVSKLATEILVRGHTDELGSPEYNQWLSTKRAYAVKDYLESRKVSVDQIKVEGLGSSEPSPRAAPCPNVAGKALIKCLSPHRRVEILISGEQRTNGR